MVKKERMAKEKEEELVRLRTEQRRMREQLRAELKEEFEQQKDNILMAARNELT